MGEKEWRPDNVLDVFGDTVARAVLVVASEQTVSVPDIADRLDVSDPTVYRRIDPLVDANLLAEHRRIDPDGNQHKEYETILDEVTFTVQDGGYTVDIQVDQDLADDFESMWSDLESRSRTPNADDRSSTPSSSRHRSDPS